MTLPRSHRPNHFTFLRLFFALLVLLSHSFELIDGNKNREPLTQLFGTMTFGDLAVDGFFLLSGFLIVQSWVLMPETGQFLKKRILRIYPGFIVATLISVFLVGPLGANNPAQYFTDLSITGVIKNITLLLQPVTPPVFQGQPYPMVNGAMWSISYELKCYLAVLVLGMVGIFHKKYLRLHLWLIITILICIVLISQKFGLALPVPAEITEWTNKRAPTFRLASFFFAGGCFYLYAEQIKYDAKIAAAAAAMLLAGMFAPQLAELALATCGAYLLFFLAFQPVPLIAGFDRLPDVSYGTYLYGWPVQKLLLWYLPSISPWVLFPLACIICLTLGVISWHLIEKPFMRLKTQPKPDQANATLAHAKLR